MTAVGLSLRRQGMVTRGAAARLSDAKSIAVIRPIRSVPQRYRADRWRRATALTLLYPAAQDVLRRGRSFIWTHRQGVTVKLDRSRKKSSPIAYGRWAASCFSDERGLVAERQQYHPRAARWFQSALDNLRDGRARIAEAVADLCSRTMPANRSRVTADTCDQGMMSSPRSLDNVRGRAMIFAPSARRAGRSRAGRASRQCERSRWSPAPTIAADDAYVDGHRLPDAPTTLVVARRGDRESRRRR